MAKLPHQISINSQAGPFPVAHLGPPLQKILKRLGIRACQWAIVLVGDTEMKQLHRRHLNDPTTTDVLTFDMREDDLGEGVHLETVLCLDEARRRAAELGHSVDNELLLYAVHSLLHVQGYNDVTPAEAARMHQREDDLLAEIGVGPVYHWQVNGQSKSQKRITRRKPPRTGNRKSKIKNQKSPRRSA